MALLLKNLLFTFLVPGTVAVWVPWQIAQGAAPAGGAARGVAAALFAVGGAIYAWCVWDFASFGRGTPAPIDAPTRLVVRGLYRFTRNPMYVGVLTVVAGWVVLFKSGALLAYALAVATAFHLFVLLYEEPHLARVFGESYASYRGEVRRWLPIPSRRRGE